MLKQFTIIESDDALDMHAMAKDLDRAKSAVFMSGDAAFFGPLMCSLDFVWAKGLETAATDGSKFFWDPWDFNRLCMEGRKSTIMHELWHVARLHALRQGNRCPDIWNIACDIWINRTMVKQNWKLLPPELWVLRPDLDHIEMEEDIYDWLISPGGGGMQPGQCPGNGHGKCAHNQIPATPQVKQQIMNATVKAVQSAKMNNQPGTIPGGVEQLIDKFLAPIIPWETVLFQWFTDLLDEDFTWSRPDRRHQEMYLPSRYEDEGRLAHIVAFEDVSGSITDRDLLRFNSEFKYIWDTFQPDKLTLIMFDTQIQRVIELENDDQFDQVKVLGRGGTDLTQVREWIMEHKPTACLVFSDLECAPMQPGPECPMIWITCGNRSAKVPFGKKIDIKRE